MPGLMDIEVQSYGVVVNSGTGGQEWRALALMGPAPEPGHHRSGRHQVYIEFKWVPNEAPTSAGSVTDLNTTQTTIKAYCYKHDFADWYDMLRNEAPVLFRCEYQDARPGQTARDLNWVQLRSGSVEPPGEGSDTGMTNEAPEQPLTPAPV